MLYVPVNANAWRLDWGYAEHLEKMLRRINADYQVSAQVRAFSRQDAPMYQFVLLKWGASMTHPHDRKREELLVTHDIKQMESALLMLISVEKEEQMNQSVRS